MEISVRECTIWTGNILPTCMSLNTWCPDGHADLRGEKAAGNLGLTEGSGWLGASL